MRRPPWLITLGWFLGFGAFYAVVMISASMETTDDWGNAGIAIGAFFYMLGLYATARTGVAVIGRWRAWRSVRTRNRCPSCGYNIYATPSRCPECGEQLDPDEYSEGEQAE